MQCLGVILAGGLSYRMGRPDKGLIEVAGRPLLSWVAERARPQVDRLLLNANGDPARFAPLGLPVISDAGEAGEGPMAGLLAGLHAARSLTPIVTHVATFASDSPLFPLDLVARLAHALGDGATYAIAASANREHPVFGLWPVACTQEIETLFASGARALYAIETRLRKAVVTFPVEDGDPFFNVNTPADLQEIERRLTTDGVSRYRPREDRDS